MNPKPLRQTFLTLCALMFALFGNVKQADAYDFSYVLPSGQTMYYNITGANTVQLTYPNVINASWDGYYQPIGNVALTASVYHNGTNYTLVSIGSGALYHCADITAVTIPATVATIGNGAFSGCTNLTTVTINSQTFMSSGAAGVGNIRYLFGEQVKNYILGSQVTSIGWGAFSGCSRMTTVTFLGHMASIGEGAFSGCNRLTGVFAAYPGTWAEIDFHNDPRANPLNFAHRLYDYYSGNEVTYMNISSSVTAIKPCAFYGAYDLTAVVIPSSVTTIGNEAFLDCFSLTEVTFDSYVTSVGSLAFGGCSALEIVKTNNVNLWCLNNFENPQANPLSITHHLYGPNGLEITEVNLSSVPYIGSYAFYGATSITSVIIPGSVQSIGECAFGGCTSLASVSFPATSSSLSYVGSAAFVGCTGMNTVSVNDLVNWCGVEFSDDASNPIVYGQHLYSNGSEITQLTIPSTVTSIGAYAFYHASHLTSLTIPSSVTYIGINAFKHCSGLTRVDISDMTAWCRIDFEDNPLSEAHHLYLNGDLITSLNNFGNVTTIKRFAFTGCTDLTSVTIPANMSSIENYAFYGCPNLTTVTIKSAAVASRAYTYFGNTDNLVTRFGNQVTSYTFGAGVTAIGEYALRGSMMTEVIFLGSVTSVGAGAFNDCNSLTRVDISDLAAWCGVVTDDAVSLPLNYGHHLYHSGSEVTDLVIPSGVNDINHGVFCGASGLNSVTFPSSVYSIGSYAFSECTGLTYLIFNGAPPELGDQAFQNVRRSIPVYVPEEYYYDYYRWGGFTNIIRNGNITFADANVKAICVDNWDGILGDTPDGELNHAEVAAVTTLNPSGNTNSSVFKSNHNITSFNELQYFTGLTSIDPYAFYNCDNLTSVRLPDEVTSIGDAAFQYCKLTSVYFPSGLTSIGDEAFEQCSLTSVNIPSHVTSIGTNPFAGCSLLTSVAVDPSNTVFDSRNSCNAIIETETNILKTGCMNTVIPDNVTAIHPKAFNHCTGLTAITLPSEATSIGDEAFAYCTGLASIVVGATTPPTAGTNAFLNVNPTVLVNVPCGTLTTYQNTSGWSVFTNYQENCGIVFADPAVKAICVASTTGWDTDHDGELNYTEAAAVTSLKPSGTSVFQNTAITSFNELKYFTGLTSIESDAFNGCTQLTSIKLPNGITSIGDHAFDGCTKLISIVIPGGVTSLGENAFGNCTGLALLTVYATTPPTLGTGVFSQVPTALRVLVPCGKKTDYLAATGWNAFANYFELCECIEIQDPGVMDICFENWDLNHDVCLSYEEAAAVTTLNPSGIPNNSVFKGNTTMSSFDELQYFTGLTSIEDYTFAGCDHLSSVTLPIGVTSIGQCAFSGCALTSVALPTWVVSIGLHAFQNCTSLTSVTLPNTLTTIGAGAFYNCSGLSSIAIPSSVTSIDANPFMGCTALTSITVDAGNPVYDSRGNCNALIKTANNQLITGCNTTVIPSSVTSIGASAFDHCTGLTSVTLPSSLTFIGGSAFYGCTGLSSITVEATTPPIVNGSTVFYGVADTIPVYVPCESLSVYPTDYGWSYFNNFVGSCFIIFADASVKAICVANWDINHDGELSYDEAAAVTDLENLFASEESITSFDELQYFTGLSTIGSSEFLGCEGLFSITLPSSVTSIGDYAFDGCEALASITIPSGVTSIGTSPFSGCSALASITVEAGNTVYDSRDNCNAIIKTSNNQLVSGCKNTVIPTSVTSIAQYAFGGCNALVSLTIPNSVGTIGNYAFSGCIGLASLTMEADNPPTIYGNTFQNVPSYIHINVPCNAKATYQAASGWSAFTNIVDPCAVIVFADPAVEAICLAHWDTDHDGELTYGEAAAVRSIDLYFRNKAITSFNELQYFTGLRLIETFAFQACSAMTSITLPYGVTTIGTNAFQNCSSLTALTLPSSVTTFYGIGNPSPFLNCSALESITVAPGNPVFDSRDNCNAIIETANNKLVLGCKNTVIPNSVTSIGQYAYAGCTSLTDFTIPSSITSIGGFAFSNCTGLTSLTIPDGVTFVSFSAFSHCSGLTSLNVEAITPPSLGQSSTFQNVSLDFPVYVPCESLSLYRDPDSPWGGFANIFGADCDIVFADDNVKAICVANWDTNEDGELSYAEAVAVTEIGTVFQGNTEITSFDELQYFVGLSHLESYEFTDCANLTSIILPSRITVIGEETFYECASLTSVILPSGLTIIGDEAFSVCSSLTSINLPNGLTTIGNLAFYGCSSLTSVDIPSTVTLIGSAAFYGCTGLSSIALPDGLTYLGGEAFDNCTGLTSITIPSSVTSIGLNPFSGCTALESIVVEAGNTVYDSRDNCNAIINTADNKLVSGCMNTVIPSAVTVIGASAFENCTGLASVTLPDGLTTIAHAAFMGCSALTSITIPSQVTQIVGYAFRDCTHLASITVERATPPTLGVNAFQNVPTDIPVFVPCHAKTTYQATAGWSAFTLYVDPCAAIVFADANVKAICVANWDTNNDGELGYDEAAAVESLEFVFEDEPITTFDELQYFTGLTAIDDEAFLGCTSLTSVIIPSSVVSIYGNAFAGCSSLSSITIPSGVTYIGSYAFSGCSSLSSITIPSSVTSIDTYAFSGCSSLTSITIPSSVTSIGNYAFRNCSALTSITIPSGVTSIGNGLFSGCTALANIVVEAGNTVYDSRNGCNAIIHTATNTLIAGCQNTVIPNTVTIIGPYAFIDCTTLTSIVIPSGVTTIGQGAFCRSGLTEVDLPITVTAIGNSAFYECTSLTSASLPNGVTYLGRDAFNGCTALESVSLPSGLTSINQNTFDYCTSLTSIAIPSGVTSINNYAFRNCSALTSITIPSAVTSIGNYAFYNCTGLTSITVEATTPPTIISTTFNNVPSTIPVYVPCSSVGDYQSATVWSNFSNIQSIYGALPWVENFDGYTGATSGATNVLPECWDRHNTAVDIAYRGYPTIYDDAANAHSGSNYVKFHYDQGYGSAQYLILPYVDDVTMVELWFYAKALTENAVVRVGVMTDPSDVSTFDISTETELTSDYQQFRFNYFDEYLGEGHYIAIMTVADNGATQCDLCIDDLELLVKTTQTLTLSEGWNWWTPTVRTHVGATQGTLQYALGGNGVIINSQDEGFKKYNGTSWSGTLPNTLEPGKMYKIMTTAAVSATLEGLGVNQTTITIKPGYNWIGYTGPTTHIYEALGDFVPSPGDRIYDQDSSLAIIEYNGIGWSYPNGFQLVNGHGYIYESKATETKTLTLPVVRE